MQTQRATYILFVGLGVYCFLCALAIGILVQSQSLAITSISAVLMCVTGLVAYEFFERRAFSNKTERSFSFMKSQQEVLLDDVARLKSGNSSLPDNERFANISSTKKTSNKRSEKQIQVELAIQNFTKDQIASFLRHAIAHNDVEVFAQPIVKLPSRQTCFYEVYAHLKTPFEQTVGGGEYLEIARKSGLMEDVDKVLLTSCLEKMRVSYDQGEAIPYILNIENRSLLSQEYMNTLLTFISSNQNLSKYLIFEIAQSAFEKLDNKAKAVLSQLSKLGCKFSMDHVENPHLDKDLVREMGIGFIKIGADKLVKFTQDDNSIAVMHRIKSQFEKQGVKLIAEKVEDEDMLKEILDLELDYGEGFAFGHPDKLVHFEFQRYAA